MHPFRNSQADPLAEKARAKVQELVDDGLSPQLLLTAVLEKCNEFALQQSWQQVQSNLAAAGHIGLSASNARLSVSTTSSKSSGRSSIMSTATTMSSASSRGGIGEVGGTQEFTVAASAAAAAPAPPPPPVPKPPAPPVKSSNRGASKTPGTYWCTFCNVDFQRKFDWKRHEDEFHERYKRYPCPDCNRVFWGANTFNQHHKNAHGCTTCPHADKVIKYTRRKTAWGCGFCGAFVPSRDRYFDHVARHYEEGCKKSEWNHSKVIYGLLHNPHVKQAWDELQDEKYGHLPKNQQPRIGWDPKTTGHAQGFLEGESPGNLQDLLEFFVAGRDDPKALAQKADECAIKVWPHQLRKDSSSASSSNATSSSPSRPFSEPAKPKTPVPKTSTKHLSSPDRPLPPDPPVYIDEPLPKKQRNHSPPAKIQTPFGSVEKPPLQPCIFDQAQSPSAVVTPISPFDQTMLDTTMSTPATESTSFFDFSTTQLLSHTQQPTSQPQQQPQQSPYPPQQPFQQPQQGHHQAPQLPQLQHQQQDLLLSPTVFDDWSSTAGTIVDPSIFTSVMALGPGWQTDLHQQHFGSAG